MTATPILTALLPCEKIIRDEATRRYTLVGIIETIHVHTFPHETPITFYARITEAHDVTTVRFEVLSLADMKSLGARQFTSSTPLLAGQPHHLDIMGIWTCTFTDNFRFLHAGDYDVRLSANDHPIGGHRFHVEQ